MGMHLFELTNVSMLFSNLFFYEGVWRIVQKNSLVWGKRWRGEFVGQRELGHTLQGCKVYLTGAQGLPDRGARSTWQGRKVYLTGAQGLPDRRSTWQGRKVYLTELQGLTGAQGLPDRGARSTWQGRKVWGARSTWQSCKVYRFTLQGRKKQCCKVIAEYFHPFIFTN